MRCISSKQCAAGRDWVRAGRRRGTAIVLMLLLSVVLTGLVLVVALSAGTQANTSSAIVRLDQATAVAESAGQIAVWKFKHDNQWRQATAPGTLPTMIIGNNTFTYSLIGDEPNSIPTIYFPFSEGTGTTTDDASANSNTGTFVGGVTWTAQGKYGKGVDFNGSTGYIKAGNAPSTNIAGSITLAAWVKLASASQDQKVMGNEDGVAGGYKMAIFGQKVEFETPGSWNRFAPGGTLLSVGVWYHIATIYDASAGTICSYVNGVLDRKSTGFGSNALVKTNGSLIIGREPWISGGNLRYFCGTMDEVRVYGRALSSQELMALAVPSLHVRAVTSQTTGALGTGATVDFSVSAPPALAPTAPSLTVGGTAAMKYLTVSGDVQADKVSVSATSTVNGRMVYAKTLSDPTGKLSVVYRGNVIAPTQNGSAAMPSINYANIAAQSVNTRAGGSNQTVTFIAVPNGVNVQVLTGNVTDPVIDTTTTSGTLYITGNLTITKNTTWGTGNPVFVVVQGKVTQTGTLNLDGSLYTGGDWSHVDSTIDGMVCIGGNVNDNSTSATTILGGGIPWFDPRGSAAAVPVPMYYTNYQGGMP